MSFILSANIPNPIPLSTIIKLILSTLSFKEISDLTNSSINTALGRMRYALINLRKMVDREKYTFSN